MKGVEPHEAGWFTRLVYWFVKREVNKLTGRPRLLEPIKVAAHHPSLLRALGQMGGAFGDLAGVPAVRVTVVRLVIGVEVVVVHA
jgi:hypothetical protein